MNFINEIGSFLREIAETDNNADAIFEIKNKNIIICALDYDRYADPLLICPQEYGIHNNIIYIYEDLWWSKGNIVRNLIRSKIAPVKAVYARNCTVKRISADISGVFLSAYHLLGNTNAKYKYGLYYGKELIAVATFSRPRPMIRGERAVSSYEWVRFACKDSIRVIGGAGKLFSFFKTEVDPEEVMSYADKEWSDGNMYKKMGFVPVGETKPIELAVDRITGVRITLKKAAAFADTVYLRFLNHGNLKFLWSRI
jgi:hypothetical protein